MKGRTNASAGRAVVAVLDPWAEHADMLARRLMSARDIQTLTELAPHIRDVAIEMVRDDVGGGPVTRTLSALHDALTARVIDLVVRHHRLPDASWCWLALGSEGRGEQTFVTDQDNGILFSAVDASEARALRPFFMACAGEINQALAACGFPLCEGGIMAGNGNCCLSLAEWQERFADWIRTPEPQALLNATIFFDLRALWGDTALVATLRGTLTRMCAGAESFRRLLAMNALAAEPPLGVLRDFAVRDGAVDLKKFGARLFVDAARIFALDSPHPATRVRLQQAARSGVLTTADAEAAAGAFGQLQRLRLQMQQRALADNAVPDNLLAPQTLNPFDRQILHEALKQARLLQQRLKTTFRIEG